MKNMTDKRTDRWTDGRMDGQMDRQTVKTYLQLCACVCALLLCVCVREREREIDLVTTITSLFIFLLAYLVNVYHIFYLFMIPVNPFLSYLSIWSFTLHFIVTRELLIHFFFFCSCFTHLLLFPPFFCIPSKLLLIYFLRLYSLLLNSLFIAILIFFDISSMNPTFLELCSLITFIFYF